MIRLKAMAMRTQGRKRSAGPTASGQSGGRSDGQRGGDSVGAAHLWRNPVGLLQLGRAVHLGAPRTGVLRCGFL